MDSQKQSKSLRRFSLPAIVLSVVAVASITTLLKSVVVIPAGYVGVVDNFGVVSKTTLKSGVHLLNPLVHVEKFSTRTQEIKETLDAPSKEGLIMNMEVSILYHLDEPKAEQVYRTIGTNYEQVVLIPQFRSTIRQVTAGYDTKALYSSQRQQIAQQIREQLRDRVAARGIIVEETPLRKLDLPEKIRDAVAEKLKAEQQSQQMQFVLDKEKQEAERKRIEARGIADSQKIISEGLDDKVLKLKQIEAMEKVAQSANAKVVVVGAGEPGSPTTIQP